MWPAFSDWNLHFSRLVYNPVRKKNLYRLHQREKVNAKETWELIWRWISKCLAPLSRSPRQATQRNWPQWPRLHPCPGSQVAIQNREDGDRKQVHPTSQRLPNDETGKPTYTCGSGNETRPEPKQNLIHRDWVKKSSLITQRRTGCSTLIVRRFQKHGAPGQPV